MQAQSAQKNWEAQARTNSILAGSLKALEERVDDCATLLDWRHEVDLKFEEMAEQLENILLRQAEADKDARRQHKELQTQLRAAAGGGAPAALDGGEAGDEYGDVAVEEPLWRRCFRVLSSAEGYRAWYISMVLLQVVAVFGLFVEASEDNDSSTKSVGAILGASSALCVLLAIPSVFLRRTFYLNLYLVCQIWVCAMAAVFTADAIQDVTKSTNFCALRGVEGLPDSDCPVRQSRARGKVFYSLATAFMANSIGAVAQAIKDDNQRREVEALIRGRGGLMALTTSKSTGQSRGRASMSVGGDGAGTPGAQPSWKGKKWSKAAPSAKKLMQQMGEA
mmetsp:Transcript_16833/g.41362  ORF Transcript_16833/g.41362 Transcript_16833/m.41362 type:complete len:336 (+) Transcript_16833:397-1404(+)